MIGIDSVVALHNTFVTADKLSAPQLLRGMTKPSQLRHVMEHKSDGYLVKTKSYEIIVSAETGFLAFKGIPMPAKDLVFSVPVLTATGFEDIIDVFPFHFEVPMVDLFRQNSEIFLAEGFFLY